MKLDDVVHINEYFRRSVNIKSDLNNQDFLEGYICPKSSEEALTGLVKHINGTGQGSFTWTGPYGAGKSSLVILLSSMLAKKAALKEKAYSRLSEGARNLTSDFFDKTNWRILPVVGEPSNPLAVIGQSMVANGFCKEPPANSQELISTIKDAAQKKNGVIIFIDEMGKFLEALSNGQSEADIYLFQQLAELANSSEGKIILVGILHQSFNEYARNLSRVARDEWTKIQGRFVDYHINTAGEEQLELISRAITSEQKPKHLTAESKEVASVVKKNRPVNEKSFAKTLNACWPLHPVVAALLGPISRRRFGQNQRSIFSFLNSAEPGGFKEFLKSTKAERTAFYYPDCYWDYIQLNLESSIIASSDAKLWALANDSLAKCEASGGNTEHLRLLKTIAVIDIFKGRSGLAASQNLLEMCGFKDTLPALLKDLKKWALVRFKKYNESFSIFEGSDFDIEDAIDDAIRKVDSVNFVRLSEIASFKPFVAKRHYHTTGALRWMDVSIVPSERAKELIAKTVKDSNAFGGFFIIVPTNIDEYEKSHDEIEQLSKMLSKDKKYAVVCGISNKYETISSYSNELLALEWIEENSHELLTGDSVARREVESRKALVTSLLEELLTKQINTVSWIKGGKSIGVLPPRSIMSLVSDLADQVYKSSPIVRSEMLNRDRPSGNANAALNALLRALIFNNGEERLGITGYPPEGGLFKALLEDSGLYKNIDGAWQLSAPESKHKFNFDQLWKVADDVLSNCEASIDISALYAAWAEAPFGIKAGLLPFFATIYLMTRQDNVALYLNETYRPKLDDLFLDYLLKTPHTVSLRWVNYDDLTLQVLETVRNSINSLETNTISIDQNASAFEIARSLVSSIDNLNPWVHRTRRLSKETVRFREMIKAAHDPNKLLFDDLPNLVGVNSDGANTPKQLREITNKITHSLDELIGIYPKLLKELGLLLLSELQVGVASKANISRLKERAKSIQGVTGDFRIDALAARLGTFEQTPEDIAGIASLAANKPIKDWIDLDVDRAKQEIVSLCAGFKKAELLARVQGRKANRYAMAFITGLSGDEEIYDLEFDLLEDEKETILKLKQSMQEQIAINSVDARAVLAAIAELSTEYIKEFRQKAPSAKSNTKMASNA